MLTIHLRVHSDISGTLLRASPSSSTLFDVDIQEIKETDNKLRAFIVKTFTLLYFTAGLSATCYHVVELRRTAITGRMKMATGLRGP